MDLFLNSEKKTTLINYYEFTSIELLPPKIKELAKSSLESTKRAYSPYSKFPVGAAVLLDNNIIISGNNQENAAYPSGLCAERVAIFYASATYPNTKMIAIAIATGLPGLEPISPCGACRQAILEYELKQNSPIAVFLVSENKKVIAFGSIADLLPISFTSKCLP